MTFFKNEAQWVIDEAMDRGRLPSAPEKLKPVVDTNVMDGRVIAEYRQVAKEIGVSDQDILVEEFRIFLVKHDIPIFNLGEVVKYLDELAAKENPTGCGWQWCPVRSKDAEIPLTFGRQSEDRRGYQNGGLIPASDYYQSHRFTEWNRGRGGWLGGMGWRTETTNANPTVHIHDASAQMQAQIDAHMNPPTPIDWRTTTSPSYTRTLPLHALKKIALIEKNFKDKIVFLVSDYCVAPHVVVNPDPFLMAVIPNSAVAHGKGRFIIDVWDEPGFGIEKMVK